MKKNNITSITGLTQDETAMWLCIPRSQWSMSESGKRSLPLKSRLHMTALLQHLKENKGIPDETAKLHSKEQETITVKFQKEIKKIQLDILRLQQKIALTEEKRKIGLAALNSADFIMNNPKKDVPQDLVREIINRSLKTLEKYSLYRIEKMKLRAENLEMLKERMEQKIKSIQMD